MGGGAHLQLGSSQPTCPADPATDASAQRHRDVENLEKDGLAAMPPTRPLNVVRSLKAAVALRHSAQQPPQFSLNYFWQPRLCVLQQQAMEVNMGVDLGLLIHQGEGEAFTVINVST